MPVISDVRYAMVVYDATTMSMVLWDGSVSWGEGTSATATHTTVNDTASSVTLLAANSARRGATIHNDSTAVLYVKHGATASAASHTLKMAANSYYEVPFGYTGIIDGIWASDASGMAMMTEFT